MGALTEVEIFDCLVTNLRTAAELADDLARVPLKGIPYDRFRKALRLAEGACRQASVWRDDFLSMNGRRDGYDETTYVDVPIPLLPFHLPAPPVAKHLLVPAQPIVIDGVLGELAKLQKGT